MARKVKESGIDWIKTIPVEWEVNRLKNIFTFGKGLPITKENLTETGIDVISYGQIHSKNNNGLEINNALIRFVSQSYLESHKGSLVDREDFIFADTSEDLQGCGNCVYVDTDKQLFAGYHTIILRSNSGCNNKYFAYLFKSDIWRSQIRSRVSGIKLFSITQKILRETTIIIPPIEEQKRIVKFLDEKVSEIDNIILKTKESIEHYKKYKQAIITEVALGGLDKAVATKNSGIDWIGNIPEHWKIKPFKFVMTERNEKNIPVKTDERLALSIDKGITTYAEKTTNLDRFKDDVTQYKLAYEGDLVFNSMNMIVGAIGYSNYFGCVSPAYYTYYDNVEGHYTSKYYEYIFRSKTMRKVLFSLGKGIMAIDRGDDKINTCRLKVSRDDLRCLKVPVPTEQEQQEIVKYLDAKCTEIDALIAKKEAFAEEMEAYKKSLIYECVTGKKEV